MARKGKGYQGRKRPVDDDEARQRFDQSLSLIEVCCAAIDEGHNAMALPLSVELSNVLTADGFATRKRGEVKFPSPSYEDHPTNMSAFHLLTGVTMSGAPPKGDFTPYALLGEDSGWNHLKFSKWWNEVVFRASNAKPGLPIGVIALRPEDQVPFDKRERLTRRLVVRTLRDHSAAHHLSEYPAILDEIDGPSSWGGFGFQDESTGTTYSTDDGSMEWGRGQLAAMIREIAEETLIAFGRRALPAPPQDDAPSHSPSVSAHFTSEIPKSL